MGDELTLTGYNGEPIDFCFSPFCLKNFREFEKKRYGSLEHLNAAWQTKFQSWDEVLPLTKEEARKDDGRHVAGWSDHLEFMDTVLEGAVKTASQTYRKEYPTGLLCTSGPEPPEAYGGSDWCQLRNWLGALMAYHSEGREDIFRSFYPDGYIAPWIFGYSNTGDVVPYRLWKSVFLGNRGAMGFKFSSLVNPDWTLWQGTRDARPHLITLSDETGRYLLNRFRENCEVAILLSQASYRAAFIEDRKKEHEQLLVKYIKLLRTLGVPFRIVPYNELANGVFNGYKALILPDTVALSDAEIAAIKAFPGVIVAEGVPGTRMTNCVKREPPPLAECFVGKNLLIPHPDTAFNEALRHFDQPKDRAVVDWERKRLAGALVKGGIRVNPIGAVDRKAEVPDLEIFPKTGSKGELFFGIVTENPRPRTVEFGLPEKAQVYNLVNSQYLGNTDRLTLPVSQGTPYALLLLPEKPEIQSLTASGNTVRLKLNFPLDTVARIRVFAPDGKEIEPYAANLDVSGGEATWSIPFALSDPSGK